MKDFEEYLMAEHGKQYVGLDDDMADSYERWLCELHPEVMIAYADHYAALKVSEAVAECAKMTIDAIGGVK